MTPRVTVGVPVYNGERFLGEALRSIQSQTFGDLEILVADNGSTDGTADICHAAAAEDSRICILRSDANRGGPWNMNRLYERASAPLFKWAFYDDLCCPELIADGVDALAGQDHAVLAYPRVLEIDAAGDVLRDRDDADMGLDRHTAPERLHHLYRTLGEQALFGVIRTSALRGTRGIQTTLADGHVLLTELALRGRFVALPKQSQLLRVHGGQHGGDRASELRWLGARPRDRVFAYTRVNGRLLRAVRESSLSHSEKMLCTAVVLRFWTLRTWRSSASDVTHLMQDLRG